MAQLVGRSLLTPEVRGSNPVIGKLLFRTFNCLSTVDWIEKSANFKIVCFHLTCDSKNLHNVLLPKNCGQCCKKFLEEIKVSPLTETTSIGHVKRG